MCDSVEVAGARASSVNHEDIRFSLVFAYKMSFFSVMHSQNLNLSVKLKEF